MPAIRCEVIGSATLYLGDALEVLPTLAATFDGVLTDPPYSSGGAHKGDRSAPTSAKYQSSAHRGRYPEFEGDSRDQRSYLAWSTLWLSRARSLTRPGGMLATFSDWRQLPTTTDAVQAAGWVWRGIAAWDKTEASRPQLGRYRAQAEYVAWGTNGPRPLAGPVCPGVFRHCTTGRKLHIAGKPVGLMTDLLGTMRDGPVLDPFMGSGTVGVACLGLGIEYVGIEIDPTYYEIACERLQRALQAPLNGRATG